MTTDADLLTRRRVIRSGAMIAAGSLCPHWAFSLAREQGGSGDAGSAAKSWTIGNELVKRVVNFMPAAGVFTEQLSDLSTNSILISGGKTPHHGKHEFSFLCNGRELTGADPAFELSGAEESELPNGKSLAVRLRHKELRARCNGGLQRLQRMCGGAQTPRAT